MGFEMQILGSILTHVLANRNRFMFSNNTDLRINYGGLHIRTVGVSRTGVKCRRGNWPTEIMLFLELYLIWSFSGVKLRNWEHCASCAWVISIVLVLFCLVLLGREHAFSNFITIMIPFISVSVSETIFSKLFRFLERPYTHKEVKDLNCAKVMFNYFLKVMLFGCG